MGVPKTGAGGPPLALALDVVTVPVLTQKENEFLLVAFTVSERVPYSILETPLEELPRGIGYIWPGMSRGKKITISASKTNSGPCRKTRSPTVFRIPKPYTDRWRRTIEIASHIA